MPSAVPAVTLYIHTAVSGPRCANMREISGHSLTELTSITTVCMGPPARLKPVNETRARACSDYDLILNATTSRTGPVRRGARPCALKRRPAQNAEIILLIISNTVEMILII